MTGRGILLMRTLPTTQSYSREEINEGRKEGVTPESVLVKYLTVVKGRKKNRFFRPFTTIRYYRALTLVPMHQEGKSTTDPHQLSLNIPPHRNHGLFADYYLDHVLPDRTEWACLADEAAPVLEHIAVVFAAFNPTTDEAQTEKDLVRPVLDALGHTYEVQGRLRVPGRIHRPDYIFYNDIDAKNANRNAVLEKSLADKGGLAVGDAKCWGRSAGYHANFRDRLTIIATRRSRSTGMCCTAVSTGASSPMANYGGWYIARPPTGWMSYYEVDLQELAQAGDVNRFLYFYAFFRRAAFDPGALGLAELLRASIDYAHGVGISLKSQVYDALRHRRAGISRLCAERFARRSRRH